MFPVTFLYELIYVGYIIFIVLQHETGGITLSDKVPSVDLEFLTKRRLYAIEFWIAFSGFSIYLSLTEIKRLFSNNSKTI